MVVVDRVREGPTTGEERGPRRGRRGGGGVRCTLNELNCHLSCNSLAIVAGSRLVFVLVGGVASDANKQVVHFLIADHNEKHCSSLHMTALVVLGHRKGENLAGILLNGAKEAHCTADAVYVFILLFLTAGEWKFTTGDFALVLL